MDDTTKLLAVGAVAVGGLYLLSQKPTGQSNEKIIIVTNPNGSTTTYYPGGGTSTTLIPGTPTSGKGSITQPYDLMYGFVGPGEYAVYLDGTPRVTYDAGGINDLVVDFGLPAAGIGSQWQPYQSSGGWVSPGFYTGPGGVRIVTLQQNFAVAYPTLLPQQRIVNVQNPLQPSGTATKTVSYNGALYPFFTYHGLTLTELSDEGLYLVNGTPIQPAYVGWIGNAYYWWVAKNYISGVPISSQSDFNDWNAAAAQL